ncbi:DnaJ domain protein [Ancylostoma caninum]|uniref:DnaJ homolog subfamily B member 9 n=1 Tax=Ancylostoma caninum TaxID=29170 RepID=A0A368G981_ANCCA|nr:DnaJ domain protein [Ancylostoma caninum]
MRIPLLFLVLTVVVIADEDYYKLLGIERDADDRTIRKAFKKLAIQKHPDKNKIMIEIENNYINFGDLNTM